jgi:hypothetical protein
MPVRPDDDLPAAPHGAGIGAQGRVRADVRRLGVLDLCVAALIVAADEHGPAPGPTRSVDRRSTDESDLLPEQLHLAAARHSAVRLDPAVGEERPLLRLDVH